MDSEWLKKPQKKLKKNVITLEEKISILNRLKNGERPSVVAKTLDLNESTIRTIKLNEKKIRDSVVCGLNINAKSVTRVRNILLEKMEKSLMIWIEDCYQKKIAVGSSDIKKKALKFYAHFKTLDQDSAEKNGFRASNGWFEKFKKRWHLYNCKIHEESQSADVETVYPPELLEIINDNGFNAEQLFKNDEIGCIRKKKPIRTFFTKNENIVQLIKKETDIESNKTEDVDKMEDDVVEHVKEMEMDYNKLTEGLNMADNLANFFKENDSLTERSSKFARQLNICLVSYRELHEKLKDSDKQCVTS